ncbi:MAG: hypothetical protein AAB036_03905 [Elusimicrobiota bacterium]
MVIINILTIFSLSAAALEGLAPSLSTSAIVPTFVALSPNPHDYDRFADGGSDANWYVGFNNAWIVKLPPAPQGEFERAYIGAKLGRAKTRPIVSKPWLRESIPGKVYIGISQNPAWTSEQSFFLVETRDIPSEPDPQARIEGVGSGEWLWAPVPMSQISFTAPNYLIVWSPTNYFTRASSAPILAAADIENSENEARAWLNRSIVGVPPRSSGNSLETPLPTLAPALAIKLVPPGPVDPAVSVADFTAALAGKKLLVRFSAAGEDVANAWVEASRDQLEWERISRIQRKPPYQFTLTLEKIPAPGTYLRGVARDISGAVGHSAPFMVPYAPR